MLTAIAIFLIFASVVIVLWVGAQDVLSGEMTPGRLSQFVLYAVFAAGGLGQLSEVWGEVQQASGAAERLFEILHVKPEVKAPANPVKLPDRTPRRGRLRECALRLSDAAGHVGARRRVVPRARRARRLRSSAPRAPARARSSI